MKYQDFLSGRFYNADTFDAMAEIPDSVIDMLLVDLPYGTTACKWDSVIPFDKLWSEYNRVCKDNAAMVFTASQPFTTLLVASNFKNFAHEWVWNKHFAGNFVQAKRQPLKDHENVIVFSTNGTQPKYYPIKTQRKTPIKTGGNKPSKAIPIAVTERSKSFGNSQYTDKHPTSVTSLNFSSRESPRGFHPTQKPVALFEYLIRTYTNEGEIVLDNTAGSGTTAIAAINSGRKWCCIERDEEYYTKAIERIEAHNANT